MCLACRVPVVKKKTADFGGGIYRTSVSFLVRWNLCKFCCIKGAMPVAKVSFLFSADCQFDRQRDRKKVTKTHNNVESEEESQ